MGQNSTGNNFVAFFAGSPKFSVSANDAILLASEFPLCWWSASDLNSGGSNDVCLYRDGAADTLALRRATNAQTFNVYETSDALFPPTDYSRTTLTTQAGNHLIRTEAGGTGTLRILQVGTGPEVGTNIAGVDTIIHGGQSTCTGLGGSLLFQTSAAGSSGTDVNALATVLEIDGVGAGFFGAAPVGQGSSVADASGGSTVDAEARTAINALISRIEATGLIATV